MRTSHRGKRFGARRWSRACPASLQLHALLIVSLLAPLSSVEVARARDAVDPGAILATGSCVTVWPSRLASAAILGASQRSSYGIGQDGTAFAWGSNSLGACELPALPVGVTYSSFGRGAGRYTMATRSDGLIEYWAAAPGLPASLEPPLPPPGKRFVQVATSLVHAAGLLDDGSLVCWGANAQGECNVPTPPEGTRYLLVAAAGAETLGAPPYYASTHALRSDGAIVGWGSPNFNLTNVPPLPAGVVYTDLASGPLHTAAVRSDGAVVVWGYSAEPVLAVPPLPRGTKYTHVACGYSTVAATRSDGAIVVWGQDGSWLQAPAAVPGLTYVALAAGSYHYLAKRDDGAVLGWGSNAYGQCGSVGLPPGRTLASWANTDSASTLAFAACLDDGSVLLGPGLPSLSSSTPPFPPDVSAIQIGIGVITGGSHAAVLRDDGEISCWGSNTYGQCDVPPLPPGVSWVALDANGANTAAVASDGTVRCWGRNDWGQTSAPSPPAGTAFVGVSCGTEHLAALRSDGGLMCWGRNDVGQCLVPPLPPPLTYVKAWARGKQTTALVSDGTVMCWGLLPLGQCGPPPLPPGVSYLALEVNVGCGTGLRTDGVEVCWGDGLICTRPVPPPGTTEGQWHTGGRWTFSVLEAQALGCSGDLDGDHVVGGLDLGTLLGAWGRAAGPADIDGDGSVGASDLGVLLANWGVCP